VLARQPSRRSFEHVGIEWSPSARHGCRPWRPAASRDKLHDHTARFAGSGRWGAGIRGAGIRGGAALAAPARGAESTNSGLLWLSPLLPAGTRAEAVLDALPGKKPLIKLTYRPPNYESPLAYLRTAITPNDEFFVRYHLADIPQVDAGTPIDPADAKTIGDYLKENYGE
jgi:hypothetical protein